MLQDFERLLKKSKIIYLEEIFPVILDNHELWMINLSPRKEIYGASIRMGTSWDQRLLHFAHKFSSFFHKHIPIWFSQTGIISPFHGWENGNSEGAKLTQPLVLVFGPDPLHSTWYMTHHPWSPGFKWTHIYLQSQEWMLKISFRELHSKQ